MTGQIENAKKNLVMKSTNPFDDNSNTGIHAKSIREESIPLTEISKQQEIFGHKNTRPETTGNLSPSNKSSGSPYLNPFDDISLDGFDQINEDEGCHHPFDEAFTTNSSNVEFDRIPSNKHVIRNVSSNPFDHEYDDIEKPKSINVTKDLASTSLGQNQDLPDNLHLKSGVDSNEKKPTKLGLFFSEVENSNLEVGNPTKAARNVYLKNENVIKNQEKIPANGLDNGNVIHIHSFENTSDDEKKSPINNFHSMSFSSGSTIVSYDTANCCFGTWIFCKRFTVSEIPKSGS